jgi:hypothetical protein
MATSTVKPRENSSSVKSEISVDLLVIQRHLRRDNVVCHGLDIVPGQSPHSAATTFFREVLRLDIRVVDARWLGRNSRRPLWIRLESETDRRRVRDEARAVRPKDVYVDNDLSLQDRDQQRARVLQLRQSRSTPVPPTPGPPAPLAIPTPPSSSRGTESPSPRPMTSGLRDQAPASAAPSTRLPKVASAPTLTSPTTAAALALPPCVVTQADSVRDELKVPEATAEPTASAALTRRRPMRARVVSSKAAWPRALPARRCGVATRPVKQTREKSCSPEHETPETKQRLPSSPADGTSTTGPPVASGYEPTRPLPHYTHYGGGDWGPTPSYGSGGYGGHRHYNDRKYGGSSFHGGGTGGCDYSVPPHLRREEWWTTFERP